MAEQEQTTNEAQQEQSKTQATQPDAASNTDTSSQEQTVPYTRFKEVNDRLKALEDEQAKAAKQREADDEKKLAEQAAWQQLADKRKTQVEELTPKAELADKLSALVAAQYEAEIKEWPETVKAMAPAEEASILEKLSWMQKAKPLALELAKDKTPQAGNGRKPTPTGASGSQTKTKIEPIYDVRRNF